jgi:hypothetical protein
MAAIMKIIEVGIGELFGSNSLPIAKTIASSTQTQAERVKRKLKKLPKTNLLRNFVVVLLCLLKLLQF